MVPVLEGAQMREFFVDVPLRFMFLSNRVIRPVESKAFMTLLDDSSFELTRPCLVFGHTPKVDWYELSSVAWLPYLFAKGVVERSEALVILS